MASAYQVNIGRTKVSDEGFVSTRDLLEKTIDISERRSVASDSQGVVARNNPFEKILVKETFLNKSVEGSPFLIGAAVEVTQGADALNEAIAPFAGRGGIVDTLDYFSGKGQSFPENPLVGVRFADGNQQFFWKEELKALASSES